MNTDSRSTTERVHFDRVATAYDRHRQSFSPSGNFVTDFLANCLIVKAQLPAEGQMLEIGCGTGEITLRCMDNHFRVTAVDISMPMLRQAETKHGDRPVALVAADISRLPFCARSFDAVIGNSILHHLDSRIALRECYRVLTDAGRAAFVEPSPANPVFALGLGCPIPRRLGWWGLSATERPVQLKLLAKHAIGIGYQKINLYPLTFMHHAFPSPVLHAIARLDPFLTKVPVFRKLAFYTAIILEK